MSSVQKLLIFDFLTPNSYCSGARSGEQQGHYAPTFVPW